MGTTVGQAQERKSRRLTIPRGLARRMKSNGIPLYEIGETGVEISGGRVRQSRLRNFKGAARSKVIREMSETDGTGRGILNCFTLLMQAVEMNVEPGGPSANDDDAAEYIDSCLDDMETGRKDTVGAIATMLPHGFSTHEVNYKRRLGDDPPEVEVQIPDPRNPERTIGHTVKPPNSKHDDGRIGWDGWPIRAQDTIERWDAPKGRVAGIWQRVKSGGRQTVYIPTRASGAQKLLHFRTSTYNGNPEGESLLECAYRAWFIKRHLEDQMAIGVKRDLTGMPILSFPDEDDIWDEGNTDKLRQAEKFIASIYNDEYMGLPKPESVKLDLLGSPGQRQINIFDVFKYLRLEMAIGTMTEFMLIGHEGAGSYALRRDARSPFMIAAGGFLSRIEEVINDKAIPSLIRLNNLQVTAPPKIKFGSVDVPEIGAVLEALEKMHAIGMAVGGDELRDRLLTQVRMPIPEAETAEVETEPEEEDDDVFVE